MSLTCPNVPDTVAVAIGNIVQAHTPAQLSTLLGAGAIKTPTASFSAVVRGHLVQFVKNVPFVTDPALLAALTAQTAPIV